jgi:CBS domain-containing protein
VDTAVISYRVADFLKKYAPFHAIEEADLLALAGGGRVKFHEPNQYILWQGEPHRAHVFVIQQGTVSLWEEGPNGATLRDVRGAGDMLGIERYNGARSCLHSARSDSDVVIYAFAAHDFEAHVLKYPHAFEYVAAESRVTPDYLAPGARPELSRMFLHSAVRQKALPTCGANATIADAARQLLTARTEAILVMDAEQRARGMLTADSILRWVAGGESGVQRSVETLLDHRPATIAPDASAADGLLKMGATDADALVITDDGTPDGRAQAVVTRRDLSALVGDDPAALLRRALTAATAQELSDVNLRARAFVLDRLAGPSSVEWLARFTSFVDATILKRILVLAGAADLPACWAFAGSAGRAELLTRTLPAVLAIFDDDVPAAAGQAAFQRTLEGLMECGYLPRGERPFDTGFYAAGAGEWAERYRRWLRDPVGEAAYRARSLFDLRAVHGDDRLWQGIRTAVGETLGPVFIHVLANDCLDSLPPLTFFQDAVIDSVGEQSETFRLEYSALRPIVDVARVFALAAKDPFGRSTRERLATARTLLPEHDAIFREAADTLQIVLWQQARVGISQSTSGAELPASLLSRHDRQVLKSGFRSILRLVEFTGDRHWLKQL